MSDKRKKEKFTELQSINITIKAKVHARNFFSHPLGTNPFQRITYIQSRFVMEPNQLWN